MSGQAGSVEALLKLNTSGFDTGLSKSTEAVTKFVEKIESLGTNSKKFSDGLNEIQNELNNLHTAFSSLEKLPVAESFNKLGKAMKAMTQAAEAFVKEGGVTVTTFQTMGNAIQAFMNSLGGVEVKLTNVVQTEQRMVQSNSQVSSSSRQAAQAVQQYSTALQSPSPRTFATNVKGVSATLTSTTSSFNSATTAVERFNIALSSSGTAGLNNVTSGVNNLNTSLRATQTATNLTSTGLTNVTTNLNNTGKSTSDLKNKMTETGNAVKTMGSNMTTASNNASTAKQRFNGLTQSLGALKSMVSMVGSMFLYNFAFGLMQSVQNTVKAKSEMMSFLNTMGMTQGQINSFNSALDATAERFQRINKYNIGETVANIGLEFDLSAKEMEKAMSVTSMVTSEYLRAGRNADEAALAVKDIMQGQFQRLSRETGVKGEQLKEAGWSGNPEDVMGLLDALEKVGKARHWDVFAEKASSLNDILLITQNRLSEFATDLTEGFTPMITDSFNFIVAGVDGIITIFGQIGNALNLPDWTGTALMITGLGAAIAGVITTTITWRTGLGLLDMAHQGLGQSIMAAVFNIKAEELANASATQVIKAKLLGLNAEVVAQKGLRGALAESVAMEQMENAIKELSTARTVGQTSSIEALILAKEHKISVEQAELLIQQRENIENMGAMKIITAKILSLDMEIASRHGLLTALGASVSGRIADTIATEGETVAEETLNAARTIGIALMAAYLAALLAIAAVAAVFLIPAIQQMQDANEKMSEFNKLVNDGDNIIKDARDTMNSYSDKVSKLKDELSKLTEGTDEYKRKQYELDQATKDLETSTHNYKYAIEAVERARSSQAKKEESLNNTAMQQNNDLIETLQRLGYTYEQAADKANKYYGVLDHGTQVNREVSNHAEWNRGRIYDKNQQLITDLKDDYSPEDIAKRVSDNNAIIDAQNKQYQKMLESESLGEYVEGYLGWQWYKGVEGVTDIQNSIAKDSKTLYENAMNFGKGINDFANTIFTPLGEFWTNMGQGLTDGFNDIVDGLSKAPQLLTDAIGKIFGGDGEGSVGGGLMKKINPAAFLKNIFGNINLESVSAFFNDYVITPITDFFTSFSLDDFFNTLFAGSVFSQGGGLLGKILGWDENTDIGAMIGTKLTEAQGYLTGFFTTLLSQFMNLPGAILGFLTEIIGNITSFASQLLTNGITAGSNFLNGVVTHISQLPGRVLSFITSTASNIINGASQWVSNARSKATETVNAVITQVSQLPNKVYNEFVKIATRIRDAVSEAVRAATSFGEDVKNAVLNALGIHSPGIVQEKIATEFANIGGRIAENASTAEMEASNFGQSIVNGMGTQMTNIASTAQVMSNVLDNGLSADATMVAQDTSMAFGTMNTEITGAYANLDTNIGTTMTNISGYQNTMLTGMQTNNTKSFDNIKRTTTTSLNDMRDSTSKTTQQMTSAWNVMKDNIIAAANQLQTKSNAHFNNLSTNIGSFYRKLQNPSMWGAGDPTNSLPSRRYGSPQGQAGVKAIQRIFTPTSTKYAGGLNPDKLPQTMSLRKLKELMGNSSIFDGFYLDQEVNVKDFLSQFDGGFGWNDWHNPHFSKIKNTSGEWKMKGPQIMHRIDTGTPFWVKNFYNGRPNVTFGQFQKIAEALFSAIPYPSVMYFNSERYGNWVNALQAGEANCVDGANALIALAANFGFSGHTQGGTWNGIPHVYAIINGKKMDTTGWQQRRDWNGVAAGGPSSGGFGNTNNNVNVTVDMTGSTFIGDEEFEERMRDTAQTVLREEVNKSISVGI